MRSHSRVTRTGPATVVWMRRRTASCAQTRPLVDRVLEGSVVFLDTTRFTRRRRTASCCRRATFLRASSRRALKAEMRERTNYKIMGCAFYLFIRQPMGRKSALRREIPWILRGFQGRLSC